MEMFKSIGLFIVDLKAVVLIRSITGIFLYLFVIPPLILYKQGVILYVKLFKAELAGELSYCGGILDQDYNTDNSNGSLISVLTLDGKVTIPQLKDLFQKNVVDMKIKDKDGNNRSRYPELKQYRVHFMGYKFWKHDPAFNISNHVSEMIYDKHKPKPNIDEVMEKVMNRVFPKNRSPWEVILIQNCPQENKSRLIFRINQTMADANSLQKLLIEGLGEKLFKTKEATHGTAWNVICYFISLPFYFIQGLYCAHSLEGITRGDPWRLRNVSENKSPFVVAMTSKISLPALRKFAKKNQATISSALMAIIAGAIRNSGFRKSSHEPAVYFSLPKPNHPPYLTNHLLPAVMVLPTNEAEALNRVRKCNIDYNSLLHGNLSPAMDLAAYLLSSWPASILQMFIEMFAVVSTVITNVPIEEEEFSVGGVPCLDMQFSGGIPKSSVGVGFKITGYKNNLQICVVAKQDVLKKNEVQKLAQLINKEIAFLLESDR